MIGITMLHYKILEKLGEGGMGVVYKAEDTKLEREVAIKFLPGHIANDSEERERFKIEAKAAASLNHPNIATIHAIEESGDDTFIVMEFIDGKELKHVVETHRDASLQLNDIINYAIQIAEGLEVAHKKGIVHRDIKSQNIMITNDGKIKIMDFGLAKVGQGTQLTKVGSTIGTIAYMSPEQAKGDEVDHRSDIWSFGVVLYEMITGRLPFKGDYDQAIIYSILNEEPEFENISPEFKSIIIKALAKNPEERYHNVNEILNDIIETQNNISADTYRKTSKTNSSKKEKKKWFVPAAIIAFILLIAVAYIYYDNLSGETDSTSEKKMIVVLPFENLGSPDDEYFADGITEEITSKLSGISGLGVIARTSAMQYKKVNKNLNQIADELGVDYVLAGTVRWEKISGGGRVKVNPELIRMSDGVQIWSEPYEAPYSASFKLQSQIASQVTSALNINLLKPEKKSLSANLTENQEAYNLYLKGKDFIDYRSQEPQNKNIAERLFKQAIDLDPDFAAAYAGLSRAYSDMYWFYYNQSEKTVELSKSAAEKSIKLDPEFYGGYAALAWYYYHCELDYEKAIDNFQHSLQLQPNNYDALGGIGAVLRRQGKVEESIPFFQKALNINPLSPQATFELGASYSWSKNYPEAINLYKKAINLNPSSNLFYYYLTNCYILLNGDISKASEILDIAFKDQIPDDSGGLLFRSTEIDIYNKNYEKALNRLKNSQVSFLDEQFAFTPKEIAIGIINLYLGRIEEAKKYFRSAIDILNKKIKEFPNDSRLYSSLGIAYAGLGQNENAIKYSREGVELIPISKEALKGQARVKDLAKVYILTGEYDMAIELLGKLIDIPSEITPAILKIDPMWDKLRGNPKFDKLLTRQL